MKSNNELYSSRILFEKSDGKIGLCLHRAESGEQYRFSDTDNVCDDIGSGGSV